MQSFILISPTVWPHCTMQCYRQTNRTDRQADAIACRVRNIITLSSSKVDTGKSAKDAWSKVPVREVIKGGGRSRMATRSTG